jgi:peptidase M1-like protein
MPGPRIFVGTALLAAWACAAPPAIGSEPLADPLAEALRSARPADSILPVHGLRLQKDVLTLDLEEGRIEFATPVAGRPCLATFHGHGRMRLEPATAIERDHLRRLTGDPAMLALEDRFEEAAFAWTDGSFEPLLYARVSGAGAADEGSAAPLRRLSYLVHEELGLSLELRLLDGLTRPGPRSPEEAAAGGVFIAHLAGQCWPKLVYVLDPHGVDPGRFGPEESGLYNAGERRGDGWWYLAHRRDELRSDERHVEELHEPYEPLGYRLEAAVDEREVLHGTTRIRLRALPEAGRLVTLWLSSLLRVREARLLPSGLPLAVVQQAEDWSDPSVGVVLPEAPSAGETVTLELRTEGRGVVGAAGDGRYFVGARSNWYPNLGVLQRRASYELRFCVPAGLEVIAVGELVRRFADDAGQSCSEWRSTVPLGVAGFNYGRFDKLERRDRESGLVLGVYTSGGAAPPAAELSLASAVQSARLYTRAFGPLPFAGVAITEQPAPRFPQAWPTLLYLPAPSFPAGASHCGAAEPGTLPPGLEQAHEMAHQWWGHTVGWKTYHDEWLTEGLADFAAALLLEKAEGRDCFEDYWRGGARVLGAERAGERLVEAGPLWLGRRLENHRSRASYGDLLYPKGSYVLHMLRMMMQGPDGSDERFLAMLRDFSARFRHRRCSTADFQAAVERAMTPEMDLEGDGRMDWFFRAWVYGTEVPSYELCARLEPLEAGRWRLRGEVLQKGVSDGFTMLVPVYVDLGDGRRVRVARAACHGRRPEPLDLELDLGPPPRSVLLNANHDVLALE